MGALDSYMRTVRQQHMIEAEARRQNAEMYRLRQEMEALDSFAVPDDVELGNQPLRTDRTIELPSYDKPEPLEEAIAALANRGYGISVRHPGSRNGLINGVIAHEEDEHTLENFQKLLSQLQEDLKWIQDPRRISTKVLRDKKLKEISNNIN